MNSEVSSSEQLESLETDEGSLASDVARALLENDPNKPSDEPEKSGTPESKPRESASKAKLETLNDLAERLGVEVKDLYSIKVPRGDAKGEPFTLGALKDRFEEWSSLDTERLSWNEERTKRDNEMHLARQELSELLAALPKESVSKDALAKATAKVQQRIKRERELTLESITEWRDEERRTADLTGIAGMLEQYGLPANYLGTVYDHRILRFMRDAYQREQQVQRALSQLERRSKTSGSSKGSGPAKKPGAKPANAERGHDARSAVISALREKAGF